jgi:hypothetical protein
MQSLLCEKIEVDSDHTVEFCEKFLRKVVEDAQFVDMIVRSDETTIICNGIVNCHNCIY